MQRGSLVSFLNGERPAELLWREIAFEVNDCLAFCAKGGAGPIIITDGPRTSVSRRQATVLIAAFNEARLPLKAASYIADAMIMSDDFEWDDEAIADAIFRLSDEGAPLTAADLIWAMNRIASAPK